MAQPRGDVLKRRTILLVLGVLALALQACEAVPDIRFDDPPSDAGSGGGEGGSSGDASSSTDGATTPEAGPTGTCIEPRPTAGASCCGGTWCVGQHCAENQKSCEKCPTLGCGPGQVCCSDGPQNATCGTTCP